MEPRRRSKGFQPAGSVRPDRLGLPAKRSRELLLALAWRRVAGEVMAGSVPARGVRRGVLEVEAPDRRWAETLRPLLPELAGRVAAACPSLGIRKCRLVETGAGEAAERAVQIRVCAPHVRAPVSPVRLAGPRAVVEPPHPSESGGERLRAVMQRYLERARHRHDG